MTHRPRRRGDTWRFPRASFSSFEIRQTVTSPTRDARLRHTRADSRRTRLPPGPARSRSPSRPFASPPREAKPRPPSTRLNSSRASCDSPSLFAARVVVGIDQLRHDGEPLSQANTLQYKLAVVSQSYATASGPHPLAALVDLTVFVTVFRKTLENEAQSATFGDSVRLLAEGCRVAEGELWQLAQQALRPEHLTELKAALDRWKQHGSRPSRSRDRARGGRTSRCCRNSNNASSAALEACSACWGSILFPASIRRCARWPGRASSRSARCL